MQKVKNIHLKINLTLIAILIIVLFFLTPFYNHWLSTNLLGPNYSIRQQAKQTSVEQRMVNRFGYSYIVYDRIAEYFKKQKIENPLVLLPPAQYLKERGVTALNMVEPAVFYYFTGYKAVWYNSPNVRKATHVMLEGTSNNVIIKQINAPEELDTIIEGYKKYKID